MGNVEGCSPLQFSLQFYIERQALVGCYNSNHATRLERVGCGTILITVRGLFRGGSRWELGAVAVQFYIETRNSLGGYNSKYRKAATCKGLQFYFFVF